MKILVLHQVPYRKIQYHLAIDHHEHDVLYVGAPTRTSDIPAELPCRTIDVDPAEDLIAGAIARVDVSEGFEHVLALSEFGLLEAHALRRHLDLPGPTIEQLEAVRDKVSMKRAVSAAGLLTPRFVDSAASTNDIDWSGRTVAKPRRGASSDGVRIFDTPQEAIAHLGTLDDPAGHQLEEFVDGPLLHADALIVDGRAHHATVSRYSGRPVDFPQGVPLGSTQVPISRDHLDYIATVVAALGITVGSLHLEFFDTDRGFVFLEAANRVGGGGIIEAHRLRTGIHLPTHEIRARLGLDENCPRRNRPPAIFTPSSCSRPRTDHLVNSP